MAIGRTVKRGSIEYKMSLVFGRKLMPLLKELNESVGR